MRGAMKRRKRAGRTPGKTPVELELMLVLAFHEKFIAARTIAIQQRKGTPESRQKWAIAASTRERYHEELRRFTEAHLKGGSSSEEPQRDSRHRVSDEGRDGSGTEGEAEGTD